MVQKQLQDNKLFRYSFLLAGVLAIPAFLMQLYADYYLFVVYGKTPATFLRFIVPNFIYYFFWIGLTISSIKNIPKFLWLSPIFFFLIIRTEGHYLYVLWTQPNIITLQYTKILAIITCFIVSLALILFIVWIRSYLRKSRTN